MNRLTCLVVFSLNLTLSSTAIADFAGMYLDSSGPVDPSGDGTLYESHRVYAVFTDSTDRMVSIAGLGQSGGVPLQFSSFDPDDAQAAPELLRDCVVPCGALSCGQTSQPVANLQGPYHSFVCLRSGNQPSDFPAFGQPVDGLVNNLTFSPDVLCSASPNPVVIEGSFWTTGGIDGGYFPQDPVNGSSTGRLILVAQFTLPLGAEFEFQGNLFYNYTPPGFPSQIPGQSEFLVASADFSGLSGCTNLGQFFSEFDDLVDDDPFQDWDQCGDGVFDFCQGIVETDIGSNSPSDCNGNGDIDICEFDLSIIDRNDNLVPDTCECIADLDGDGDVNLSDIVILLFAWKDSVDFDVVATPGPSQGIIDQSDLDAVLAAAVPPASLEEAAQADRPFLSGCGVRSNAPSPPLPAVQPGEGQLESQPELTREGNSDGLSPENAMPSFLPVAPEPRLGEGETPRRKLEQKVANSNVPKIEQAPEEIVPSGQASGNIDALSNLFEILSPSLATPDKEGAAVWDLDQDGLLDPWSVIILPLSSWPEELRPFAELLRP